MIHYSFIGYILASAIILLLCAFAYRLLFENKVNSSVNRKIILVIYCVMLFFPLIVGLIPVKISNNNVDFGELIIMGVAEDITDETISGYNWNLEDMMSVFVKLYYGGLLVLFLISFISVFRLLLLIRNSVRTEVNGMVVYLHDSKKLSSFSWFNRIFLYRDLINMDSREMEILLTHEQAHSDHNHWIDLAVAQIILIFQWFNPAVWFMRRELQRIHEYEADEIVLSTGVEEKEYQMLLIRNISRSRFSGLTDGLNNCSLKKRIIMMKRKKNKKKWGFRCLFLAAMAFGGGAILHIPAVASTLELLDFSKGYYEQTEMAKIENFDLSDHSVHKEPIQVAMGSSVKTNKVQLNEWDTIRVTMVSTVKKDKDYTSKPISEVNGDGKQPIIVLDGHEISQKDLDDLNPDNIQNIRVLKNTHTKQIIITTKQSDLTEEKNQTYSDISGKDKVYVSVDEVANYTGGVEQLLNDLDKTIIYPKEAVEKKIEGKVVVKFVVDKKGDISSIGVVRGIDPQLDAAAIDAVRNLPNRWIPGKLNGKPVDSYYNLPVTFKLKGK